MAALLGLTFLCAFSVSHILTQFLFLGLHTRSFIRVSHLTGGPRLRPDSRSTLGLTDKLLHVTECLFINGLDMMMTHFKRLNNFVT